jgi:hypothetical protein
MLNKKLFFLIIITMSFLIFVACGSSSSSYSSVSSRFVYPNDRLDNAIDNGSLSGVISALAEGAKLNYILVISPLMRATIRGHLEIVQYMVENGANLDLRSDDGNTALMFAAEKGNTAIVKYLVENDANINARNNKGETALSWAYDKGEMGVYDYLIAHGAREFEPRQIAQQPVAPSSSSTTVIVQPSAPSQAAPAQSKPSASTLQIGTYAANRTNITMRLNLGQVTAYSDGDPVAFGTYQISGNQVVITFDARTSSTGAGASLRGNTYVYTITSNATFSGNGEDWARSGY